MKSNNAFRNNVSLKNNDEAISPVIGTILMVAVTVILAAVIAAFVFGFTGQMPKAPNVAYYQIERVASGDVVIKPTNPSIVDLTHISFKYNGVDITATGSNVALITPAVEDDPLTTGVDESAPAVYGPISASGVITALASANGLVLADTNPATADTISVYASVSGLPVQLVQEVTL